MSSSRRASGHSVLWRVCYAIAWAAALALVVVAALRIVHFDGTVFLTWLNAFTRYLYLPAYVCLAWAAWQRRWVLAAASFLVVGCHVMWMTPDFLPDRRFAESDDTAGPVASSRSLRVFFANVLQSNRAFEPMFDEIAAANPDVLVVTEWGWHWNQAFKQSPLATIYTHGINTKHPQIGRVNLFSKIPLVDEIQMGMGGRLVHTADVPCAPHTLRVIGLHAPRPLYGPTFDYRDFWQQALPLLRVERGPLLVIGDFNATEHSHVYQQLKAAGLRSAHEVRGRGYAVTWPNGSNLLPPIRIDQAFISKEVVCERIVEGRGTGSDHKPLIVDVRIRNGPLPPGDAQAKRQQIAE